jgi:hypothetical protein
MLNPRNERKFVDLSVNLCLSTCALVALCSGPVRAQTVAEPPIPAADKARIAKVAREALDSKDISLRQYKSTIAALHSSHCQGVDRALTESKKTKLAPIIALQEGWESVKLHQSFRLGSWHIIYLENGISDDPYLFFPDSPAAVKSVGMWGGGATVFETSDIKRWLTENIPGIPPRLAACFAWHVTLNPD